MMADMEDSGTLTALRRLARTQRIDLNRVLVLRTVSNYSMQPKGKAVAWSTTASYPEDGRPALEAAYPEGNQVEQKLINGRAVYRDKLPTQP